WRKRRAEVARLTTLAPADMAALAAEFELGQVSSFAPLDAGTINSNFALETERGCFFVRINEGKERADVDYEVALVLGLSARGVPTPVPRAASSGERTVLFGDKW